MRIRIHHPKFLFFHLWKHIYISKFWDHKTWLIYGYWLRGPNHLCRELSLLIFKSQFANFSSDGIMHGTSFFISAALEIEFLPRHQLVPCMSKFSCHFLVIFHLQQTSLLYKSLTPLTLQESVKQRWEAKGHHHGFLFWWWESSVSSSSATWCPP